MLTSRAASPKRRSTSRAVRLTQAGGARGRRAWAARAGGADGRRKRAARAGGARGWREVAVCRLRADGAALLGGRGWPPSVRCGFAMGRRSTPKGVPGIVGAGPKDLPSSIEGSDEVRSHCWCPHARGPFSRQDVSKHEFEETDRSARRRHADVAAEDQGSDGRGCDDGAREASESGIPSRWRSLLPLLLACIIIMCSCIEFRVMWAEFAPSSCSSSTTAAARATESCLAAPRSAHV